MLIMWQDPATWHMGWTTVLVPNAIMMINHARGGSPAVFNFVIRRFGYHGLFALPFVGMFLEKSFYDTAVRASLSLFVMYRHVVLVNLKHFSCVQLWARKRLREICMRSLH